MAPPAAIESSEASETADDPNIPVNGNDAIDDGTDEGTIIKEAAAAAAAPQAQEDHTTIVPVGEEGEDGNNMEYVKLSPLDVENQRRNLKDMLLNNSSSAPPPPTFPVVVPNNTNAAPAVVDGDNNNGGARPQPHSALHRDEYSAHHYSIQEENSNLDAPRYRQSSALESANSSSSSASVPFRRKNRLLPPNTAKSSSGPKGGGERHSHPRKSPYKSEVARLRHSAAHRPATAPLPIAIKDTTAPPDTAYFSKQSAKLKEAVLSSLGDFLTGAFADDEENSGSYFSEELLDQLSSSDPRLRGVWLQAKNLTDDHVRRLCDALIRNKVVTEVWLPSNKITDVGAGYVAHMLKFNRHVKELFLGNNDIGPKGASALAAALARGNATLTALGLGDNRIGVEGAGAFAAALRHNHVLQTLDIKNNGIPARSSIRSLLGKMLEFNLSDPWDESLVLGLQEELVDLVRALPSEEAERVVGMAEEALKTAMLCMRRGDKVGAAEAESAFIRICTTGKPPVDPPGVILANEMRPTRPVDPEDDETGAEPSALELDAAEAGTIEDENASENEVAGGVDVPKGGDEAKESEDTDEANGGTELDASVAGLAADVGQAPNAKGK